MEFRIPRNSQANKLRLPDRHPRALPAIMRGRAGRGRPKKLGHLEDTPQCSCFCVQLEDDDLYMLVIPREFKRQPKKGLLPRTVTLKTSIGFSLSVHIEDMDGDSVSCSSTTVGTSSQMHMNYSLRMSWSSRWRAIPRWRRRSMTVTPPPRGLSFVLITLSCMHDLLW